MYTYNAVLPPLKKETQCLQKNNNNNNHTTFRIKNEASENKTNQDAQ